MKKLVKIDTHIHLAGTGCCNSGIWISETFKRRYTYRGLKFLLGISTHQEKTTVDRDFPERISALVRESAIDYGVVLGFDGVFEKGSGIWNEEKSQLMIPSEWVFKVCREYKNLLPGPSINPFRSDALEKLSYCIKQGAVLIKWLPPAQGIDPSSELIGPFYKMLAESGIPLLVHTGAERTFATVEDHLDDISKLVKPLEAGVKVICAHSATWILGHKHDQTVLLKSLLKRYPNLWLDNSGLCNPSRFFHVPRLGKDKEICERTLYGSDWPVPINALYYLPKIGAKALRLEKIKNVIDRDIAIKQTFGYPDSTMTRANHVLANLDKWVEST